MEPMIVFLFLTRTGIHRTFHKFIKPAEIPKGWKFDAKARSEQRHKLPYDQGDKAVLAWMHCHVV